MENVVLCSQVLLIINLHKYYIVFAFIVSHTYTLFCPYTVLYIYFLKITPAKQKRYNVWWKLIFLLFFILQEVILPKNQGSLGFSIIGGTDHSCVPFGANEPGIFISHVSFSFFVLFFHFEFSRYTKKNNNFYIQVDKIVFKSFMTVAKLKQFLKLFSTQSVKIAIKIDNFEQIYCILVSIKCDGKNINLNIEINMK